MIHPDFDNTHHNFVGTNGLVLVGSDALSYIRDNNTTSYPHGVDLAGGQRELDESPFETFRRELHEEFGLNVARSQIVYARQYPGLVEPSKIGYFVVAQLDKRAKNWIRFGDEGENYQITTVDELLAHPALIPRRKQQIEAYLGKSVQPTLFDLTPAAPLAPVLPLAAHPATLPDAQAA